MQSVIAGVANTVFFLGTIVTYFTIERWGRRKLMIWTGIGCIICIAIYLAMNSLHYQTKATQWTSVAMVIIYEFFIGWGYMGPPWLYGGYHAKPSVNMVHADMSQGLRSLL